MTNNRHRLIERLNQNHKQKGGMMYQLLGIDTSKPVSRRTKKIVVTTNEKMVKKILKVQDKHPLLMGMGTYEEKKHKIFNQREVRTMTTAKPLKRGMHHKKHGRKF